MRNNLQQAEEQLSRLRRSSEAQGWTVCHEYVDRASGTRSGREQFLKLYADASQGKFDIVFFWSLDQFSQEGIRETFNNLEVLSRYGVGFRSFMEPYINPHVMSKQAIQRMLAEVAEQERLRRPERTLAVTNSRKQVRVSKLPLIALRRSQVATLRAAGLSISEISEKTKISRTSVHRILKGLAE